MFKTKVQTSLFWVLILALASSCTPSLKVSPIPKQPIEVDEEMNYILKTDQKDRKAVLLKVLFQPEEKYMKNEKVLAVSDRDSIRLSRVMYLDENRLINSEQAKFNAGIIYLHTGGKKLKDNLSYLKRASELFEEILKNSGNKKLKKRSEVYYEEAEERIN